MTNFCKSHFRHHLLLLELEYYFRMFAKLPQPLYVLKTEVENRHRKTGPRQVMETGEELGRGWWVGGTCSVCWDQLLLATNQLWPWGSTGHHHWTSYQKEKIFIFMWNSCISRCFLEILATNSTDCWSHGLPDFDLYLRSKAVCRSLFAS